MRKVTNTYHVAGINFYQRNVEELAEDNEEYSYSKKDILDYGLEDEKIYRYEFHPSDVQLEPEPDNEHDKNAVKVIVDGYQIGYIKKGSAVHILKQINAEQIVSIRAEIGGGPWKILEEEDDEKYSMYKEDGFYWASLKITEMVEGEEPPTEQVQPAVSTIFCTHCGCGISSASKFCPKCGKNPRSIPDPWDDAVKYNSNIKESKSWLVTLLLCLFLGWLGAHRFYTRRYVSAVFYVLTCGWWGIGALVDLIVILCHKFTDADGNPLE